MVEYSQVGLRVGLEWHQRLETRKLFCNCPSELGAAPPTMEVARRLRAAMGELGEIDPAALVEHARSRAFTYQIDPGTSCLVEADETPPHPFNEEALRIALGIALLFRMEPVDEVRCMRKTVIDGSNTAGFQRTMLVAVGTPDSVIETPEGPVGLKTLCLEEESAFIVETGAERAAYRLDRLGIPLVEVATTPDIRSPAQARRVAERVGAVLRATGRVQRGLGTIRQDVNISIAGGARQEVKGVQELELIQPLVEREVERQLNLLAIRDVLVARGGEAPSPGEVREVSEIFSGTGSRVLRTALDSGGAVMALRLRAFAGLLGREVQEGRRLGTELADYARVWGGVKGLFHTDELPGYGVTAEEVGALRARLGCTDRDAVVLVAGPRARARAALEAVARRSSMALRGVPEETRRPLASGNTEYQRPLPGAARMYPETDIPPIKITREMVEEVRRSLPPLPEERVREFLEQGLSRQLAEQLVSSPALQVHEAISRSAKVERTIIANTLLNTIPFLRREGLSVERLNEELLVQVFKRLEEGDLLKDQLQELLQLLAQNPELTVEEALHMLGASRAEETEIEEEVRRVVEEHMDLVRQRGKDALAPLMGIAMKRLRGRAPGILVHRLLVEEVEARLR